MPRASLVTQVVGRLVRKRDRHHDAILEVSCDVTFSGRIFNQIDLARTDGHFLTVGHLQLCPAAEGNHVLTHRTGVPIASGAGGRELNWTPVALIVSVTPPFNFISTCSAWLTPSLPA